MMVIRIRLFDMILEHDDVLRLRQYFNMVSSRSDAYTSFGIVSAWTEDISGACSMAVRLTGLELTAAASKSDRYNILAVTLRRWVSDC